MRWSNNDFTNGYTSNVVIEMLLKYSKIADSVIIIAPYLLALRELQIVMPSV